MRWIMLCVFVLMGCTVSPLKGYDSHEKATVYEEKAMVSETFFKGTMLKPIPISKTFNEIVDWYDEETIIYSRLEDGITSLYLYQLYSGKTNLFYKTKNPIFNVSPNHDLTFFAIQELHSNHHIGLTILNKKQEIVFQDTFIANEFQIDWNPYVNNKLVITALRSDWNFDIYSLDILTKQIKPMNIQYPFVQWLSPVELAYINWGEFHSTVAPLFSFNTVTEEKEKILDQAVAFFSYFGLLVVIKDVGEMENAIFTFYSTESIEKVNEFHFPIFNTYSEQWWIPELDYSEKTKRLYYLKPLSDDAQYISDRFAFVAYSVERDEEEVITGVEASYPIRCSPSGLRCLTGSKSEILINIPGKEKIRLVQE